MREQKSLLLTKVLVLVSVVASLATVAFNTSFYPFFNYKLYPQPLGSKGKYTEYRIYSRATLKDKFKRNEIKETYSYDYDSYGKMINYLVSESLKPGEDKSKYRKKLLIFAQHIYPDQTEYKIVSETYHPSDLLNSTFKYDTATVITF